MTVQIIDPYNGTKVLYYWLKAHRWDNGTYNETYKDAIQNALASAYSLQEMGGAGDKTWEELRDRTMYEHIFMKKYKNQTNIPHSYYVYVPDEYFFRMVDLKLQVRKTITEKIDKEVLEFMQNEKEKEPEV